MIAWMAGIFYLPRLFVYHAQTQEQAVKDQFKIMERRLWLFITPFALLTLVLGIIIMYLYGASWLKMSGWLHAKLLIVALFYFYHFYLWKLVKVLATDENKYSATLYGFLNEAPVITLLAIVLLAILKPF